MSEASGRRYAPWLIALVGYVLLTVVCTWPLVLRLNSVVPNDAGDPLFVTCMLWWNAQVVPLTTQWWDVPMFWPLHGAMALSEHFLGLSLLATPLQWLGADPVTAYNVLFLLSFPLCALAAHALAYEVTARHDASAIAGAAFGFNPYRISQISHLQMLWVFWMPLALVAMHRNARDRRARWPLMFGAMWVGQALSNNYFLLFFSLLVALWLAWFLGSRAEWPRLRRMVAAWAGGAIVLLPIGIQYLRLHARLGVERTLEEIQQFSADVAAFASASPLVPASALLRAGNAEQQLFPGVTVPALVLAGIVVAVVQTGRISRRPRTLPVVLSGFAGLAVTAALYAHFMGGMRVRLAATTILSITTAPKPLTVAIWCALAGMAASSTFRRAWSARSVFAFYVGAAAIMYVFSLGPVPVFAGQTFWYRPPYAWLLELPGFSNVRAPARFAMLAELCLSVAAAVAFANLSTRVSRRLRMAVAAVALAGVVVDGWIRDLPLANLPTPSPALIASGGDGALVELPLGGVGNDTAALYHSLYHRRPIVNGYSGFVPVHYRILSLALESGDIDVLDAVRPEAAITVVDDGRPRFTLPQLERGGTAPSGHPLPIHEANAAGAPIDLGAITDGDPLSKWDSGSSQHGAESVTMDLGSIHSVDGLTLTIGPYLGDYPRSLTIETAAEGAEWSLCWSGHGSNQAVAAALREPHTVPLTFVFAPARARWVRLRQTGTDQHFHWSIADATVYGR
jgi:hypothetical protein